MPPPVLDNPIPKDFTEDPVLRLAPDPVTATQADLVDFSADAYDAWDGCHARVGYLAGILAATPVESARPFFLKFP